MEINTKKQRRKATTTTTKNQLSYSTTTQSVRPLLFCFFFFLFCFFILVFCVFFRLFVFFFFKFSNRHNNNSICVRYFMCGFTSHLEQWPFRKPSESELLYIYVFFFLASSESKIRILICADRWMKRRKKNASRTISSSRSSLSVFFFS